MQAQNLKDFISISLVMSCLTLTAWTFRENQRRPASVPAPCAAPVSQQTTYAPSFSVQLSWPQAASQAAEARPFHPSQLSPAEPWLGVTAARRAPGLLAVWSTKMVQRSEDDGATYQTVLAGDDEIREVVFDDAGNFRTSASKIAWLAGKSWRETRAFRVLGKRRTLRDATT